MQSMPVAHRFRCAWALPAYRTMSNWLSWLAEAIVLGIAAVRARAPVDSFGDDLWENLFVTNMEVCCYGAKKGSHSCAAEPGRAGIAARIWDSSISNGDSGHRRGRIGIRPPGQLWTSDPAPVSAAGDTHFPWRDGCRVAPWSRPGWSWPMCQA